MGSNTAGSTARLYQCAKVHYIRKAITFADDGVAVTVGTIPAGSIIIKAGVVVSTAFNDTGTDLIDIGISGGDTDGIAADLDVSAEGLIVNTTIATSDDLYSASSDLVIRADYAGENGNADAGAGVVFVTFIPPHS